MGSSMMAIIKGMKDKVTEYVIIQMAICMTVLGFLTKGSEEAKLYSGMVVFFKDNFRATESMAQQFTRIFIRQFTKFWIAATMTKIRLGNSKMADFSITQELIS